MVEESDGLKGSSGTGELGNKRSPRDDVLTVMWGSEEEQQGVVDTATFGVQVEEVVEEKGEGKGGGSDELGMNLSGMFWGSGIGIACRIEKAV